MSGTDGFGGPVRTFAMPVERGAVEAFCRAVGEPDTTTVPPTFAVVADRFDPDYPRRPPLGRGWEGGLPDTLLHVEQWFELVSPLQIGETVEVRRGPGRSWEREGRSGRLWFVEERTELVAADGGLRVATGWVDVRTESAHRDLSAGQRPDRERATVPARPDEVPLVDPVTPTHFVGYVGAAGDLHPLHHDQALAHELGYPDVFAPGMLTMALTARALGAQLAGRGGTAAVAALTSRFRAQVWPGDALWVQPVDGSWEGQLAAGRLAVRTRNQFDDTVLDTTAELRPV